MLGVLGRGLQDEFPNPERIGCPGREIVAAIALLAGAAVGSEFKKSRR